MKKILLGLFLAISVCGFVGCNEYEDNDYETLREKCKNRPSLPECQEDVNDNSSDEAL